MKILVIALNFSPEIVGCAKYTSELVDWFSKKSKKVIVITTNPFYPNWKCKSNYYNITKKENIVIIRCPIYIPKKPNGLSRSLHYISFFLSSLPIILYISFKKIDLAFSICPTILSAPNVIIIAWIKKFFYKKKIITWIHYADFEIEAAFKLNLFKNKILKKLLLVFEKNILNNFDVISAISFYMLDKIKSKTNNYKKAFYLPIFIETKKFNNISANKKDNPYYKKLSLEKRKIVIMYSGSLNEKISCHTLINTIKILDYRKDLIWIICGEGPKKEFLTSSLKDYKNVLFYNFQSYEKLPYWLNIGDIHLIPQKISAVEFCLPSKLLSILAVGKPVIGIAPKGTELGEILDEYGVRLSSEEAEEMKNAILNLIEDNQFRLELSVKSKKYIMKFHEKESILKDIFAEVQTLISFN
tara:strand:- start:352 stop:1593 length:1242 start_codon:yes stop_codon:yes gene_type:complete